MLDVPSDVYSALDQGTYTVVDLLRLRAINRGAEIAYTFLVDGETEADNLTYTDLDRRSRAIGAALQLAGATGERVLLMYPSGLEFITAFLGCLYAGAIAVPAYPPRRNMSHLRLFGIIEDSEPAVVLATSDVLATTERIFRETPYAKGMVGLATEDVPDDLAEKWREPAINGDTLAVFQYTSGSTSAPKGVMVSHSNILSNARMIQNAFGGTEDSSSVWWLPLYHDMGLVGSVLLPLYLGSRSVLMPPTAFLQKPFRWLRAISKYRATTSGGPNFAYDLCVRKIRPEERSQLDLSSWSTAFNGAEPIFHETLERFTEAFATCGFRKEVFYPCYGLAEATLLVTGAEKDRRPVVKTFQSAGLENNRVIPSVGKQGVARRLVGCGRSPSDQRLVVVQPESLTQCLEGEVGEVWVSGPNVALGYWRRGEETEQVFRAYIRDTGEGPFLRTGDLGFILERELFITGRLKDLIIIDGRNHYPQDIELTVEKSHFAIRPSSCAAFSIYLGGRERLVAVAEIERHYRDLDQEGIVKAVRQAVAEQHEVRIEYVWLLNTGSIPKTSSGKIQRHACKAKFLETLPQSGQ